MYQIILNESNLSYLIHCQYERFYGQNTTINWKFLVDFVPVPSNISDRQIMPRNTRGLVVGRLGILLDSFYPTATLLGK